MYIYAGNNRTNATLVVETNSTVAVGAPVRIPISSGAIVVLQVSSLTATSGSAVFSYQVIGTKYRWFEYPFINLNIWYYWLFLAACALAAFLVIFGPLIFLSLTIGGIITIFSFCGCFGICFCCCCKKKKV